MICQFCWGHFTEVTSWSVWFGLMILIKLTDSMQVNLWHCGLRHLLEINLLYLHSFEHWRQQILLTFLDRVIPLWSKIYLIEHKMLLISFLLFIIAISPILSRKILRFIDLWRRLLHWRLNLWVWCGWVVWLLRTFWNLEFPTDRAFPTDNNFVKFFLYFRSAFGFLTDAITKLKVTSLV